MSVRHAKILSHIAACSMAVVAERIMQGSIIFGDLALIDFHICPLNLDRVPGVLWVGGWGMGDSFQKDLRSCVMTIYCLVFDEIE